MSGPGIGGRAFLALVLAFLYLPILIMALMAFNASPLYALPVQWSTVWFERLPQNTKLMQATFNSLGLATATSLIATILGTAAALGLARLGGRLRGVLEVLLIPPIAVPWLIIGTAMLVFAFWSGVGRGLHAMLIGHVALALPYVVLILSARLRSHRPEFEEAAQSLGASPFQAFRLVTLPLILPAVLTAALFAFAASLDQFVISYFLAGAGITTLPVEIYAAIRKGFTPEINAVSTLVILLSMLLVIPAATAFRRGSA